MACPFFLPTKKADRPQPTRAPLGSIFDGECHAGTAVCWPEEPFRYQTCNFGYARGVCPAFPADAETDAIRFTVLGGKLIYVYERDHNPVEHGEIGADAPPLLASQARAFNGASKQWKIMR